MKKVSEREEGKFLTEYTKLDTKNDAYLDILLLNAGYVAQTAAASYYPFITVKTQLVDAKSNNVIYAVTIQHGESGYQPNNLVQIEPMEGYSYANIDMLVSNIESALKGIGIATEQIADRICGDLQ